eukprot:6452300-Lingulodinium_polyedra.AAC.1
MCAAVRGSLPRHVGNAPSGPDEVKSRGGLSVGTVARKHDVDVKVSSNNDPFSEWGGPPPAG